MKRLLALSLFAIATFAAPAPNLLDRPDVVKSIAQIRHDSFGPLHIEYALLVRPYSTDFVAGAGDNVQFKWADDILAVIHTHPDKGCEKPSPQDIATAKDHGRPVYVVSEKQIWVAMPNGDVSLVP